MSAKVSSVGSGDSSFSFFEVSEFVGSDSFKSSKSDSASGFSASGSLDALLDVEGGESASGGSHLSDFVGNSVVGVVSSVSDSGGHCFKSN